VTTGENNEQTVYIPLTRGKYAVVDGEDYARLAPYSWHAFHDKKDGRWLAVRGERMRRNGRSITRTIWMHREILHAPEGVLVEHLNGDGMDNRKTNLQRSTRAERYAKRGKLNTNTSGYCGVRSGAKARRCTWATSRRRRMRPSPTTGGRGRYSGSRAVVSILAIQSNVPDNCDALMPSYGQSP